MVEIVIIILIELEVYCQDRLQKINLFSNWLMGFLAKRIIYFLNNLPYQMETNHSVKVSRLNLINSEIIV